MPVGPCCWRWMLRCVHDAATITCSRLLQGVYALLSKKNFRRSSDTSECVAYCGYTVGRLPGKAVQAISEGAPGVPVSVKCRIGVDDMDDYMSLHSFVSTVAGSSPVKHFVIHTRKCLLKGLSPHQNRTVPPLRCDPAHACQLSVHANAITGTLRTCSPSCPGWLWRAGTAGCMHSSGTSNISSSR